MPKVEMHKNYRPFLFKAFLQRKAVDIDTFITDIDAGTKILANYLVVTPVLLLVKRSLQLIAVECS